MCNKRNHNITSVFQTIDYNVTKRKCTIYLSTVYGVDKKASRKAQNCQIKEKIWLKYSAELDEVVFC